MFPAREYYGHHRQRRLYAAVLLCAILEVVLDSLDDVLAYELLATLALAG